MGSWHKVQEYEFQDTSDGVPTAAVLYSISIENETKKSNEIITIEVIVITNSTEYAYLLISNYYIRYIKNYIQTGKKIL